MFTLSPGLQVAIVSWEDGICLSEAGTGGLPGVAFLVGSEIR